jgi:hypothetical protein
LALALDLGPSKAKLTRAREHAEALIGEARAEVVKDAMHTVRITPVDPESGWHAITMVPEKIDKPELSVILGDVIHNLRSALDYVIPPLVEASEAKLSTKHEFPIYLDARDYAHKVGSKTKAKSSGPLRGISLGLANIADWQPYNTKGNPEADPLWGIHRFSNADKHRQLTAFGVVPMGEFRLHSSVGARIVERDLLEEITDWEPHDELPLGRVRFTPADPGELRAVGAVGLETRFFTPYFGKENKLSLNSGRCPDSSMTSPKSSTRLRCCRGALKAHRLAARKPPAPLGFFQLAQLDHPLQALVHAS